MLTDLESVFRRLKSEMDLRANHHQTTDRVTGHIFISLLGYHIVHTIRYQLKKQGIHSGWDRLRKQLDGQVRMTMTMHRQDTSERAITEGHHFLSQKCCCSGHGRGQ